MGNSLVPFIKLYSNAIISGQPHFGRKDDREHFPESAVLRERPDQVGRAHGRDDGEKCRQN